MVSGHFPVAAMEYIARYTRVYALLDLTPAEIRIIEASTKYRYGEV